MKDNKYDLAVVIGRFQPVHKGHIPTLEKAATVAKHVLIVIGSVNQPRTPADPFTYDERKSFLENVIKEIDTTVEFSFCGVEDRLYQHHEWVANVRKHATKIINERSADNDNVAILGHEKDETSFYLTHFKPWKVVDTGPWVGDFEHDDTVSATHIRSLWFEGKLGYAKGILAESVYNGILDWCSDNEREYFDIKEWYEEQQQYIDDTQLGAYPVQFNTTDAVVVQSGNILMVRRKYHPGKGLWALPGGFIGIYETAFEACLRELLEETRIKLQDYILERAKCEEKLFDHPRRSLRGRTFTMAYSFLLDSDKPFPKVKGNDDALEARWIPLDEVFSMRDQIFEDHLDIIHYFTSRL